MTLVVKSRMALALVLVGCLAYIFAAFEPSRALKTTQVPVDDDNDYECLDDEKSDNKTISTGEPKISKQTLSTTLGSETEETREGDEDEGASRAGFIPRRQGSRRIVNPSWWSINGANGGSGGDGGGGGGGGHLDEGGSEIPGGGYPGCGQAPLNRFTPGNQPFGAGQYIINGERQQYGEFPQYIHLETRQGNMVGLCGGTLISNQHVLTAAHCVKNEDTLIHTSAFTVIFGEDNMRAHDSHELRVQVRHICVSARYTHDSLRYDWAIITLATPVQFNNYIQPACLPNGDQLIHTHGPQSKCFLVGAGAIGMNANLANPSRADAVSSQVVNKLHTENVPCMIWGFGAIDMDRVCYTKANNMNGDSCVGDSGGPILCLDQQKRWTLMASVSYGSTFCEHSKVAVYARTRTLLPEIQQQCGIRLL